MAGNDEHTLLLLHGEDLTDSSPYGVAITNKNVTVSNTKSKFGGKSLYFNGSTAALTIKSNAFNFGSGDFTVDWWEYCTGNSATRFSLSINGGCGGLCAGASGDANKLYVGSTGTSWNLVSGADAFTVSKNTWVHWAVVRNGTSLKTFRNGTLYWSGAISGSIYWNAAGLVVGSFLYDSSHYFGGYIDEFRVSNIARWTDNFTPPTEPYSNPVPPPAPASLQNLLAVRLAWSAADGATSYNVYRNGTLLGSTMDTVFVDSTAEENQEYTYAVSAVGSGGESAKTTLTVYTKSGYFLYKPYVESATFQ